MKKVGVIFLSVFSLFILASSISLASAFSFSGFYDKYLNFGNPVTGKAIGGVDCYGFDVYSCDSNPGCSWVSDISDGKCYDYDYATGECYGYDQIDNSYCSNINSQNIPNEEVVNQEISDLDWGGWCFGDENCYGNNFYYGDYCDVSTSECVSLNCNSDNDCLGGEICGSLGFCIPDPKIKTIEQARVWALGQISDSGILLDEAILGDIAENYEISPQEIYDVVDYKINHPEATVDDLRNDLKNINVDSVLDLIAQNPQILYGEYNPKETNSINEEIYYDNPTQEYVGDNGLAPSKQTPTTNKPITTTNPQENAAIDNSENYDSGAEYCDGVDCSKNRNPYYGYNNRYPYYGYDDYGYPYTYPRYYNYPSASNYNGYPGYYNPNQTNPVNPEPNNTITNQTNQSFLNNTPANLSFVLAPGTVDDFNLINDSVGMPRVSNNSTHVVYRKNMTSGIVIQSKITLEVIYNSNNSASAKTIINPPFGSNLFYYGNLSKLNYSLGSRNNSFNLYLNGSKTNYLILSI